MMNANLAIALIIAIWVILIAALVIWFFVTRARRRRTEASSLGPLRRGSGTAPPEQGADETQPLERLRDEPIRPPSHQPGPEPFGLTTQQEYERLAAEPFQAPPAAGFGERRSAERFSWAEASNSGPTQPATPRRATDTPGADDRSLSADPALPPDRARPVPAAHRATGITGEPVSNGDDDADRTVVVSRDRAEGNGFAWALSLPDGELLPLGPDVVVGRRPMPIGGAAPLLIADATRTLSKSHARLRFDGARWWVTDLGSTNGLWLLNGDGTEEEVLPHAEVQATTRLRLGTLDVELRHRRQRG